MEVQDGFIVGIFNYCDRWCETCSFTSRCRVFADAARHEAAIDPSLKELIDAPTHPQDVRETPGWLEEALEEMNEASIAGLSAPDPPPLPQSYTGVSDRARAYGMRFHWWIIEKGFEGPPDPSHPLAVISWFSHLIGAKVHRAVTGLAEDDGDREFPPDHEGSAKVALIGIERSETAWRDLVAIERVTADDAAPFLCELSWLRESLETLLPNARAFVRPGLDEPDEVRMLDATEC
jgi:hypothetical protein